jgi:DNA-binding GntR family transcriptional regulator
MPSRSRIRVRAKKTTTAPPRQWRASLIRKHGEVLGYVEARDRASAELAAMADFNLTAEQRKRLVVQERV